MQATPSEAIASLAQGRRLFAVGSTSVWSFSTEPGETDDIPVDIPAKLTDTSGSTTDARILAVGDESVVLSLPAGFAGDDRWALTYNARFVNEGLLERLDELAGSGGCDEGLLTELTLPDGCNAQSAQELGEPTTGAVGEPDDDQALAARRAVQPGVRFTCGAPGTGKTRVLAMAVAQAVAEGHRVLVLAHHNAAVDLALERTVGELGGDHPEVLAGRVVRVGTPSNDTDATWSGVLPAQIAGLRNRAVADRVTSLTEALRRMGKIARSNAGGYALEAQMEQTRAQLRDARSRLHRLEQEVVGDATVVATTLSRAVTDDRIWSLPFDVIVVDDASTAPLPIVPALVMRGARTVSFFGDLRRPLPVARSEHEAARRWFTTDVFDFAGVRRMHEQGAVDPRLHMLSTQFRTGHRICSVVGDLAYDGLLSTAPSARDAAARSAGKGIGAGEELVIVDTSGIGASCGTDATKDSSSRINLCHAVLAASLAESLLADGFRTVGVISPYRAQVQLLTALTRNVEGATAATIHRSVDTDCEAVVLDLTDAAPMLGESGPAGEDTDLARRLFNVAVSRARHKLVVLADTAFTGDVMAPGAVPRRLLDATLGAGAAQLDASWVTERLIAADAEAAARCDTGDPLTSQPVWFADWSVALDRLSAAGADAGSIEANVAASEALARRLAGRRQAVVTKGPTAARAAHPVTHSREPTGSEPVPDARCDTPWVVIDGRAVAIGSTLGDGPVAVVGDPVFTAAFRRVATPDDR